MQTEEGQYKQKKCPASKQEEMQFYFQDNAQTNYFSTTLLQKRK